MPDLKSKSSESSVFQKATNKEIHERQEELVHVCKEGVICLTDSIGRSTPKGMSPVELVLDSPNGTIPLWGPNVTLKWCFNETSFTIYKSPERAKDYVRELMGEAILAWGDSCPIKFTQDQRNWDFEIFINGNDQCNTMGCVLASAFFPSMGRERLTIFPKMFELDKSEQIETLIHELGHIFGLRHFFAKVKEDAWPAEIFGTHSPFTIMNYGNQSMLTDSDKMDLKRLYQLAWSGNIRDINGTPIHFMFPYSTTIPFMKTESNFFSGFERKNPSLF